jgi:hypothetical protein
MIRRECFVDSSMNLLSFIIHVRSMNSPSFEKESKPFNFDRDSFDSKWTPNDAEWPKVSNSGLLTLCLEKGTTIDWEETYQEMASCSFRSLPVLPLLTSRPRSFQPRPTRWSAFESGWKLSRIEKRAFRETGLVEMILPASVEFLGEECFSDCRSLSSVTFEQKSRLPRVCPNTFMGVPVHHPTLPTKTCCLE